MTLLIKLGFSMLVGAVPFSIFGKNSGKSGINDIGDLLCFIGGLLILGGMFTLAVGVIQWLWTL